MNKIQRKRTQGGFTLIEILIVIGIIAVLAAIVLVAINPARQFRQANNAQRESNVNAILNAIGQYAVDNKGITTGLNLNASADEISSTDADICGKLVPKYLPALPTDPESSEKGASVDCVGSYATGYEVAEDADGRITVSAPLARNVDTGTVDDDLIAVSR